MQLVENLCADCYHPKENHLSGGVCSGDLTCMCPRFIEPILYHFAQLVEKEKIVRKKIQKRCEFILEKIPQTRNAGEKSFAKIYWEIWHGFKIRKGNPQALDSDTWKRLPNADTINRAKRKVKQLHDNLKTYDPRIIEQQTAIFQAMLELTAEDS